MQHPQLNIPVVGSAHWVTQGKTWVQCSWWLDFFGYGQIEGDGNRRDSLFFKDALYQSNGLVTKTSGRG